MTNLTISLLLSNVTLQAQIYLQQHAFCGLRFIPNNANYVIICIGWACRGMFHTFLTPSFALLGVNAKSRCLKQLSSHTLFVRKAHTVFFPLQNQMTRKNQILHLVAMWTHNVPNSDKKVTLSAFIVLQPSPTIVVTVID